MSTQVYNNRHRRTQTIRLSQTERGLLRFITAGSVDDGKSTLIVVCCLIAKVFCGSTQCHLKAKHKRTVGDTIDLSLLTDGFEAELLSKGITIDVAYRYFRNAKTQIHVADTPGHEQYTRNMVTGASPPMPSLF